MGKVYLLQTTGLLFLPTSVDFENLVRGFVYVCLTTSWVLRELRAVYDGNLVRARGFNRATKVC